MFIVDKVRRRSAWELVFFTCVGNDSIFFVIEKERENDDTSFP